MTIENMMDAILAINMINPIILAWQLSNISYELRQIRKQLKEQNNE